MKPQDNLIRLKCPTSGDEHSFRTSAPIILVENIVKSVKWCIDNDELEIDGEYIRICDALETLGFIVNQDLPEPTTIEF